MRGFASFRQCRVFGGALLLFALPLLSARPVRGIDAPTKDQCIDAHEQAQVLQQSSQLIQARESYRVCSHATCPKLVKTECDKGLAALKGTVPSVKLAARERGGAEPQGLVTITLDGQPPPTPAPDGSIELDPGEHVVRFTTSDGRSVERTFKLEAGQKGMEVLGELEPASPSVEAPAPQPEQPKIRPVVYALGGVAVVGLAGFVGFGLSGKSKQSDMDSCKPNCPQGDYDSMKSSYLFADISLGVALVAGGIGAYIYLSDQKKRTGQENVSWVRTAPTPGGAKLQLGTTF